MHNLVTEMKPLSNPDFAGFIRSLQAEDPFLQASSLEPLPQEYTQLSSGAFLGRILDLSLGPVRLFREAMNQAVDEKISVFPGFYTVGIPFLSGGTWQNRPLETDSMFMLPPGETALLRTPQKSDIVVALIDRMELQRHAQQKLGVDAESLFKGSLSRTLDATVAEEFRSSLNRYLMCALNEPDALSYAAARHSMADGVIELCLQVLGHGADGAEMSRQGLRVHRAMVERAREYILSNPSKPPTVSDLCTYLNMSQRGLHHAFMQVLDINPVTFIRNVRLHGVRRALREGAPSVSGTAQQWGFWHMGMFSSYYKELFGEKPSETVKKSPQIKPVRWICED